jgi:hypothetical protein
MAVVVVETIVETAEMDENHRRHHKKEQHLGSEIRAHRKKARCSVRACGRDLVGWREAQSIFWTILVKFDL